MFSKLNDGACRANCAVAYSGWVAVRCGQSRLLDVSAHPYHPIDIRTSDHLKSMKYSSTAHCSPQPFKAQFQFPRRPEDPAGFTDPGGISGFRHPAYCRHWDTGRLFGLRLKVYGYSSSQSNLPHRYGNSHAIIGSHSVTCRVTEVTFPPLPQPKLVLD